MRNPRRWRTIALAAAAVGAVMAGAAALLPPAAASEDARVALVALGLNGFLFGAAGALWAHRAARAMAALARGDNVLARWRVDAATWRLFLDHDVPSRDGMALPANELSVGRDVPAEGIDIVIGREAIAVADAVHVLPARGTPEVLGAELIEGRGGPDTIELQLLHPPSSLPSGGMSAPLRTRFAFPVAPGAGHDARRVVACFAQGRPGDADIFHGRGDGSDPEDLSVCDRCGCRTHQLRSTCPQCGAPLLSRRWTRRYGIVLVVIGVALAIGMGVLLVKMSPMLLHPGVDQDGMRFTGTPEQAKGVWAVLAAVFVFGITASGQGLFQLLTGRRNKYVAYFLFGIAGALCLVARWM